MNCKKFNNKILKNYLGNENKELIHLQNNINKYNDTNEVLNLQAVQNEDMQQYLQIDDKTLCILKDFILKISEKNAA